jgi:hypothetical protein
LKKHEQGSTWSGIFKNEAQSYLEICSISLFPGFACVEDGKRIGLTKI